MKSIILTILFTLLSFQTVSHADTLKCPSQDFSKFLQVFSENIIVQKAYTRDPIEKLQLDLNAEPEPKPIVKILSHKQINFPLIAQESARKKDNLVVVIKKMKNKKINLTLNKPDTDYQIVYIFGQTNSCWMLERIEDWSL